MADGCHGNSSSWYRVLKDTQDKHRNTFQHEYLTPLRNNFTLVTTGHSHTYPPILTHSLTHSLTHTLTHSLTHTLTHSLTHSHTHSLTLPLTHSLTHSFTLSSILSLSLSHSLTHSLTHSPSLPSSLSLTHSPSLPSSLRLELGILLDLVQAQLKMADWQFLPSLLCLQGSHTKLLQWCGLQLPGTPVSGGRGLQLVSAPVVLLIMIVSLTAANNRVIIVLFAYGTCSVVLHVGPDHNYVSCDCTE